MMPEGRGPLRDGNPSLVLRVDRAEAFNAETVSASPAARVATSGQTAIWPRVCAGTCRKTYRRSAPEPPMHQVQTAVARPAMPVRRPRFGRKSW